MKVFTVITYNCCLQDTLRSECELKDVLLLYIHAVFQDTLRSERELKELKQLEKRKICLIHSVVSAS